MQQGEQFEVAESTPYLKSHEVTEVLPRMHLVFILKKMRSDQFFNKQTLKPVLNMESRVQLKIRRIIRKVTKETLNANIPVALKSKA